MEKKIATSVEQLCKNIPSEFAVYLNYCKNLRFEDKPDYLYLKNIFWDLMQKMTYVYDYNWDWKEVKESEEAQK